MKSSILLLIFPVADAFSSIPADNFRLPPTTKNYNDNSSGNGSSSRITNSDEVSSPWRVALDIGREPLARMPDFDWARSGCKMPLVIPTDFSADNVLSPKSETVMFTGPNGAVVSPVVGEGWHLSKDEKTISLSYTLPEKMERRDVYIEAGTELVLSGRVYTQEEMDRLNKEYYEAREELWKAGKEISDIYERQNASKKWDEETNSWVKRYKDENPFRIAQKEIQYKLAEAVQGQKMAQRPDLNDLSNRGSFPGIETGVYFEKKGVVRAGKNGPVCGTWSAEPITNAPVSYRS